MGFGGCCNGARFRCRIGGGIIIWIGFGIRGFVGIFGLSLICGLAELIYTRQKFAEFDSVSLIKSLA